MHCHNGILVEERSPIMSRRHHFTDDQKAELLSNPFTFRITDCTVVFTLAFKQFVISKTDIPGMTARKIFQLAGYSDGLFTPKVRRYIVSSIREEAASPEGLKEPAAHKDPVKKKHSETEFKELQERVAILEQQVEFLKKTRLLRIQDQADISSCMN
ncbi:MAG: hypothetical protein IJV14_04635 [Lachnospiraceae bacterium]|nr:hypothetical protein [Lachnospiraceae bacterium]